MSKQSTGARPRAANQPAKSRRQRRRPRGEVYRQPPRVRARTQNAVQALDASRSGTWNEPGVTPATTGAATPDAKFDTTPAATAEPSTVTDAAEPVTAAHPSPADTKPLMVTVAPGDSQSQSRLPRRTRTLADVVQPRRDPALSGGALSGGALSGGALSGGALSGGALSGGALSGGALSVPTLPSLPAISATGPLSDPAPSASDPAATAPADVDTTPLAPARTEAALAGDEPGDEADDTRDDERRTAPLVVVRASNDESSDPPITGRLSLASIPVPRGARVSVETRPIAAASGVPPAARSGSRMPVGDPWGTSPAALKNDEEVPSRFLRGARHGTLALAVRVALGHAVAAVVLAVVASALVLLGHPLGLWLLALAGLAAAGGGLAYLLLWWLRSSRIGLLVLALTQVGALAWGCALLGPRAALLVLAAPAVALALRAGGRWPALLACTGLVAVYAIFQLAPDWGFPPAFAPPGLILTAVDTLAVALGMGLLLVELLVATHTRERDLAAARARLYEVRLLRGQIGALRAEMDDNGRVLDEALAQAVRGRGVEPVALEGPLSLVAGRVNATAERLRTLQHDREERLRLEGATRTLARALERGWLGLPWIWPEVSGTMLDEVIVLLRTPRPADTLIERRERPAREMRAPSLP